MVCYHILSILVLFLYLTKARPQDDLDSLLFENQKDCSVIEKRSGESKPCQFPFIYKSETFYGCTTTDGENGKAWCSTLVDQLDFEHVNGGEFYGDCLLEECPTTEIGLTAQSDFVNVSISKYSHVNTYEKGCILKLVFIYLHYT